MGKTKSLWRQVQRQGQTVLQKNMDGRISAAPVTKIRWKMPTPKIFLCIIAASLSLMNTNTIRMRRNCDKEMKGFRQPK